MDVLLACRAHDHVREREPGGKVETERLSFFDALGAVVDGDEVGELAPQQGLRLAVEVFGKLARDIGQGSKSVRLPEPAAAGVFEFVDKIERLLRLPFYGEAASTGEERLLRDQNAISDHQQRHAVDR